MRVEYFEDTDTLQITFSDRVVSETRDLDENTLLETDADGRLVSLTIEHPHERAEIETFLIQRAVARAGDRLRSGREPAP